MKIFAESQVAKGSVFTHLGYLASVSPTKVISGGKAMTCLGIILLLTVSAAVIFRIMKKRGRWKLGLTISAILLSACLVFMMFCPRYVIEYVYLEDAVERISPEDITYKNMSGIQKYYLASKQSFPDDIALLEKQKDFDASKLLDGWGRKIVMTKKEEDGKSKCTLTSLGNDGKIGTNDDIVVDILGE